MDILYISNESAERNLANKGIEPDGPWFPRQITDFDEYSKTVQIHELEPSDPGFDDESFRKRREFFSDIALAYKHGQPIPRIDYTPEETNTWKIIYQQLRDLHKKYACQEYLQNFELLEQYCGYGPNAIPQLEDVSTFLKKTTGFQIRPAAGYLSSRCFLAGLAFRIFHCTQYIRHWSSPAYSPEPDCCHELLGHMPMFVDPEFAQFSQEIGLASLGASDEDIDKLAKLYFFSIEFGLLKKEPGGPMKVYGAGLLACIKELKHIFEENPLIFPFEPDHVIQQEIRLTGSQTTYFYTKNFQEIKQKLRAFTRKMKKSFDVQYDDQSETINVFMNFIH